MHRGGSCKGEQLSVLRILEGKGSIGLTWLLLGLPPPQWPGMSLSGGLAGVKACFSAGWQAPAWAVGADSGWDLDCLLESCEPSAHELEHERASFRIHF